MSSQFLTDADYGDLCRLDDLFSDGEGYDLPKDRMRRLAQIGVIRRVTRDFYEITSFGSHVLGHSPRLPLLPTEEYNDREAALRKETLKP